MQRWIIGAMTLLTTLVPLQARAVSKEDMEEIIRCLDNPDLTKLESWEKESGQGDSARMAFMWEGRLYTVSYSGTYKIEVYGTVDLATRTIKDKKTRRIDFLRTDQRMLVLVGPRPEKGKIAEYVHIFIDLGVDGALNVAFEGTGSKPGWGFSDGSDAHTLQGEPTPRGFEFREYWQKEWEAAIRATLAVCRK